MRILLLAGLLALAAPSGWAGTAAVAAEAADWRKLQLPDGARESLRGAGFRLEDDGRVLDPRTRLPLTPDQLNAQLVLMNLNTQRLALEKLNFALGKNPPDRAAAEGLKGDLPADVAGALDANKDLAAVRALSESSLERIAAYFDASRTPQERRDAAGPVLAGTPGPRVPLPYFDAGERALGDSLRAAAAAKLGADPVGRTILARLNGAGGKPDLPPILVEDLTGGPAEYDYRRRALVVDRMQLLSAAADGVAPKDRAALATSLASLKDLTAYLNAHPEAVKAFAAANDAVLAHELTHAWQDRREPVLREMARGNLPQALVTDYEIEAWTTKNLYIHSVLKHNPRAAVDSFELDDYRKMAENRTGWIAALRRTVEAETMNAMDIATVEEVQAARLRAARARPATTREEQEAKALDLAGMTRAQRELREAAVAQHERLSRLAAGGAAKVAAESPALLAAHYLAAAQAASGPVDFSVLIQKAGAYADKTGDAALIAKVRALKESRK